MFHAPSLESLKLVFIDPPFGGNISLQMSAELSRMFSFLLKSARPFKVIQIRRCPESKAFVLCVCEWVSFKQTHTHTHQRATYHSDKVKI